MARHAQLKFCDEGMLEDTNSLDGAHILKLNQWGFITHYSLMNTYDPKFSDRQVWANSVDPRGAV